MGFLVGDSVGFFVGDCRRDIAARQGVRDEAPACTHKMCTRHHVQRDSALTSVGFLVGDSVGFFVGDSVGFCVGDCGRKKRRTCDVSNAPSIATCHASNKHVLTSVAFLVGDSVGFFVGDCRHVSIQAMQKLARLHINTTHRCWRRKTILRVIEIFGTVACGTLICGFDTAEFNIPAPIPNPAADISES